MQDQRYLLNEQYKDANNLSARILLHQRFSTNRADWQRWVFDQFTLPQGSQILELGCGPGHLWQKNLDRIPPDWQITLSDFSPGMLDEARKNLASDIQRFTFQVIDAQSIPFNTHSLDCVIANHMLYHVPDRAQAFKEIRRVLRPGGHFYAAANGRTHLREIKEFMQRVGLPLAGVMGGGEFYLENGAAQMAPWFAHCEIRRYENALRVPEAEPLVAFVRASIPDPSREAEKLHELRLLLEQELARNGTIVITKDTGLFVAF